MATNASNFLLNSILGAGSSFFGDIETHGLIRIDGFFNGSLKTDGKVVISKDARCHGPMRAASIVVGGIVKGSLFCSERVEILTGAIVVGDIFAPRIDVQEGTQIHGDCRVSGPGAEIAKSMEAFIAGHGGFPASPRESLLKGGGEAPWRA